MCHLFNLYQPHFRSHLVAVGSFDHRAKTIAALKLTLSPSKFSGDIAVQPRRPYRAIQNVCFTVSPTQLPSLSPVLLIDVVIAA